MPNLIRDEAREECVSILRRSRQTFSASGSSHQQELPLSYPKSAQLSSIKIRLIRITKSIAVAIGIIGFQAGSDGTCSRKAEAIIDTSRPNDLAHVLASPHFRDTPIRAFYGLRFPPFPDLEGIIPENEGIIQRKFPFLRRRGEVTFSHILLAEKRAERVLAWVRASGEPREPPDPSGQILRPIPPNPPVPRSPPTPPASCQLPLPVRPLEHR
jgi:hypothetical protein